MKIGIVKKMITICLFDFVLPFGVISCSLTDYSLKSAFDTVIENDSNSHLYFSYNCEEDTVVYDSNPLNGSNPSNEQSLTDLFLYMAMIDFSKEDYYFVRDLIGKDYKGELNKKHRCYLESTSIKTVAYFSN